MAGALTRMLGRPAAAATTHRYWRVKMVTLDGGAGGFVGASEIEMRIVAAGADQCTGGTAIDESHFGGFVPANAFDNNNSTDWASNGTGTNAWIGYDFGAGNEKDIVQVTYRQRGSPNGFQIFTACNIDYSDNGSAWTTKWSESGLVWGVDETKTFDP